MRIELFVCMVFAILTTSCLQNVEDITVAEPVGDVSFANDIQPIFNSSCTGCHGSVANGNLRMRNYNELISSNGFRYGNTIIVAGDADQSGLVDSIEPEPSSGIMRMPQGGPYLTATQIQLIRTWIDEGAQDN